MAALLCARLVPVVSLLVAALPDGGGPAWCPSPGCSADEADASLLQVERQRGAGAPAARAAARAALVIKIHDSTALPSLRQALCLVTHAHNAEVRRDVIVFTDEGLADADVSALQSIAAPARLEVVVLHVTPQSVLAQLPAEARGRVEVACKAALAEITWDTVCGEETNPYKAPMSYLYMNWFRILQLWTHPRLDEYDYLLQMDADAFCTKPWDFDPVQLLVDRNLTYIFNAFPSMANYALTQGVRRVSTRVFGRALCNADLQDGHLSADTTSCGEGPFSDKEDGGMRVMWGSFQVARLSFFRGELFQRWAQAFAEEGNIFLRRWDDQTAMTVALALTEPEKAYKLRGLGVEPGIFHNNCIDDQCGKGGFLGFVKRQRNDGGFVLDVCGPLIQVANLLGTGVQISGQQTSA
uniref:Hexosyltransferase n=1 Tax=Alexandrium monilatum TaxID=311494 RepID=A0A7S4T7P5_9DINO